MLNMKRLAALGMAAMMTLGLGMTSLAASTEPNFVVTNGVYSAPITANTAAEFKVGPANASYKFLGYGTSEEAKTDTQFAYNFGEDKIESITVKKPESYQINIGTEEAPVMRTGWATVFEVAGKSGQYGPVSIKAYNKNVADEAAYVDLTAYVEAAETQADVKAGRVQVVDVSGEDVVMLVNKRNINVQAAAKNDANPFHDASGCAQSYPTVGDSLYSLVGNGITTFAQGGGYIESITIGTDLYEQNYDTGLGWSYCVLDAAGNKVPNYDIVSASVFPVEAGYRVVWAFGTYAQTQAYFNGL